MIDFLQRYVIANFGYKIISLGLAIGLWWAISHDPVAEVEVTVPIEFSPGISVQHGGAVSRG